MAIELTQDLIAYQAGTKLIELAVETAEVRNPLKLKDKIKQGAKIHRWLQALDYSDYLSKSTRDRIVRCLVEIAEINALPVAPVLGNVQQPGILVGIPGRQGDQGPTGPEGGGVPFSATNVTEDTICDSFPITESRGVEYTINIYDDSAGAMRIMRLGAGWTADGSSYKDDGGIGDTVIGDCSGITMSVIVSGSTVQLFASVTSGEWTIEGTRKYVPNNGNGIVNPTTLANGRVWVGNASNSPTAVTVSGDFTISNTGVGAISSGVIVNNDISGSAAIALNKLATLTPSRAVVTDGSGVLTTSAATATEVSYLSGVTSSIQTQLDGKLSSASGAISTVVNTDLTASRAVISNPSGKIAVSSVTSTELGHLSGVTSSVQTQLNSKAPLSSPTFSGSPTAPTPSQGDNSTRIATTAFVNQFAGGGLKTSVIEIGTWNMDANTSKVVDISSLGFTDLTKIRDVRVVVRRDDFTDYKPLDSIDGFGDSLISGSVYEYGLTFVDIRRRPGGQFDAFAYSGTSVNRGWITIFYED
jgi:hypothetical protein